MKKVYVDSDIILDLIQQREPHYQPALALFSLMETNKIKGFVSPLIFSNLFYILRKFKSRNFASDVLIRLSKVLNILTINDKIIELALTSDFKDFEDAVQYYTALDNKMDYLVTRNKKDYKESAMIICTSQEFINFVSI